MKNKDLWKQYEDYTKDLTTNCRKLGFAAAGICWFFKTATYTFPKPIMIALGCIVSFFIADILQFLFGSLFIRFWTRSQEKVKWKQSNTIEGDYEKPAWLDYPAFTMWWIKIICLLFGYIFIGIQIFTARSF